MSEVEKWYIAAIERGEKPDLRSVLAWIYYQLVYELEQFSIVARKEAEANPSDDKAARWLAIFQQDAQQARDILARAILAWDETIPPDQLPGSLRKYHSPQAVEINAILHCVIPIIDGETSNDVHDFHSERGAEWSRKRKAAEERGDRIMFLQTIFDHRDNQAKL